MEIDHYLENVQWKTKYILFGVNIQLGATFIYYSLEKNNVYYRYNKSFTSKIKIGNKLFEKEVKYFVRDLSLKYQDDWYDLEKLSIKRVYVNPLNTIKVES